MAIPDKGKYYLLNMYPLDISFSQHVLSENVIIIKNAWESYNHGEI